ADFYASVNVLAYDEYLTALMDLQQGGVDGVLIDLVVAEYRIAGLGDDSLVVVDSLEDDLYGIGFRKEDVALRDKVNEILLEMEADGTIAAISEKWFGKNISIVGAAQ
ncbi:MAG: transporter substrate-binding domain-containing protein, partial [Clostridia bacterium]|nr:transporter substrate-binding domain-containing protein [Clostridia bacterium]